MPADTPGMDNLDADLFRRIETIEDTITRDIGMDNCSFHLMLHEFEALLFSRPEVFSKIASPEIVQAVMNIRLAFPTPEHIDDSPATAPSKRLLKLFPTYAKVRHGTLLSRDIGIDVMLRECPHFSRWINSLLELAL